MDFNSANVLRYLFCFQNIGKTLVSTFFQQSTFSIYSKKTPWLYCRCFAVYCIYQTEITIWTRKTQLFYRLVFRLPKNWLRVKSIQSNVLRRVSRRNKLVKQICLTHVAFSFAKLFSLDGYKPLASWPVLYLKPKRGRRTAEISKPFYLPEF